ncbi:TetR/AcrR family transcriptional regulator [Leucobacter sp. HY1908]
MTQSAANQSREAKMRRTRIAITEHARKLTAAHGLAGFTVEDVCEPAGISRRTFFNYFASKEAAVIGTPPDALESDAIHRFMANGTADGTISPTLLDDLVEATIESLDEVFDIAGTITHVHEIVRREPAFLEKFISESEELHARFAALIAEREGLPLSDPRPRLAIQLVGGLLHSTVHEFFHAGGTGSIGPALREALALSRELFAQPPAPTPA